MSTFLAQWKKKSFAYLTKRLYKYYFRSVFVLSSNLVLTTERTKSRDRLVSKLVEFGRFMTSEGTETLILAFASKTGQSVAQNRHGIFYLDFSVREWIYLGT